VECEIPLIVPHAGTALREGRIHPYLRSLQGAIWKVIVCSLLAIFSAC